MECNACHVMKVMVKYCTLFKFRVYIRLQCHCRNRKEDKWFAIKPQRFVVLRLRSNYQCIWNGGGSFKRRNVSLYLLSLSLSSEMLRRLPTWQAYKSRGCFSPRVTSLLSMIMSMYHAFNVQCCFTQTNALKYERTRTLSILIND